MGPVDAAPADLETVRRILREHAPGLEARAFGSRVSWTARETSDLDLALMTDEPLDAARMAALRSAFTDSRLPFRVDVVDWAGASDGFREAIESGCVTLVGKPGRDAGGSWPTAPLGQVAELTLSSVDKKSKPHEHAVLLCNYMDVYSNTFIRSDLEFMTATATEREIQRCALWPGDVVITKDSEQYDDIGVPALVRDDIGSLVCGYHLAILRPLRESIYGHYLLYALQIENVQHQFHAYANGVTRFGLRKDDILRVEIPLPPLSEQHAIARVLGALDDKIDLNRRMNETLEAMAQAVFKSWFVDFAPVRAKAEGRDTGLPGHIAALFPDRLVDSELGEIPEGWAPGRLGGCFALTMGQSPPGNTYNDHGEGLPFFQGRTDFGFRYPENRISCTEPTRIARSGDTLVSVRAPVGDINMAWEKCCIGRGVAALRHKSDSISFTYYSVRSLQNSISMYEHSGTVFGAINRKQFEAIQTLEPRSEVVETFDALVSPLDYCIRNNVLGIRILTTLRDTLLPKLVSGEVRLGEAVERLESAA